MKKIRNLLADKNRRYLDLIAYSLCILFIIAGILVSLNRFWQYEVFYFDFGVFDQAIWNVSHFTAPVIEHFIVGGKWIFADHFNPSIFLLSPLYLLTNRNEMLLVAQAIAVGLSGVVLYDIGKYVLKNKFLGLGILICYLFFLGLQNAVITEFHDLTVMTLPLMFTFWAIIHKKTWIYFLSLAIALGFKETTFLLGVGIGISIFFLRREWMKFSLITIILSLLWGYVGIKVIIPWFSNDIYIYAPSFNANIFTNILSFADHPLKQRTLFYSFFSFGFLPLIAPEFWFLILQDYATRFIGDFCCSRWDLGLHYNAQSAAILGLSSVFALRRLQKIKIFSKFLPLLTILLIGNALFLYRFVLHGPLALAYNPVFYAHTKDLNFLNNLLSRIPKNASVMTQNNLAARFTHQKVYILRKDYEKYKPEYIVVDLRRNQNPNDFFGSKDIPAIMTFLRKDPNYELIYKTQEQFIFRRKKL